MAGESSNAVDGRGVYDGESAGPKAQKDEKLCEFCRFHKKKCEPDDNGGFRCKRCIQRDWPCTERVKASGRPYGVSSFAELLATMTAAQMLLSLYQDHSRRLLGIIFPWPCFNLFYSGATSPRNVSRTLSDEGLRHLVIRLQLQICIFDNVKRRLDGLQLSPWILSGTAFHELQQHLPSFLNASSAATSVAYAGVIASSVRHWMDFGHVLSVADARHETPLLDRMRGYHVTASNLAQVLQCHFFKSAANVFGQLADISQFIWIDQAIPASHIAYFNGDRRAAFALWKQAPGTTDMLGRTLIHVAAELNDIGMLRWMAEMDCSAITRSRPDARGFSVFAIVICLGHLQSFNFILEGQGASNLGAQNLDSINLDLFDLALASGRCEIVGKLVQLNHAFPPYPMHVRKTIELGRPDMAYCLLPRLWQSCWNDQREIDDLKELAERKAQDMFGWAEDAATMRDFNACTKFAAQGKSMAELATKLHACKVRPVSAQETVHSLEGIRFSLPGSFQ